MCTFINARGDVSITCASAGGRSSAPFFLFPWNIIFIDICPPIVATECWYWLVPSALLTGIRYGMAGGNSVAGEGKRKRTLRPTQLRMVNLPSPLCKRR